MFFAVLHITLLQAITWNGPVQLFSGTNLNSISTKTAVSPNENAGEAAWIVCHEDGGTDVYTASYTSGVWSPAAALASSMHTRNSLSLVVDAMGTYSLVCEVLDQTNRRIEAAYNSMGTWSTLAKLPAPTTLTGCFSLHVAIATPSTTVVSWINPNSAFEGIEYASGTNGTPYAISASDLSVLSTQTATNQAIFVTAQDTYASALNANTSPVNTLLLHRSSIPASLCLATQNDNSLFVFQDTQSNFLLSVMNQAAHLSYFLIAEPTLPVSQAQVALNSSSSNQAAAIWQLSNGAIYVTTFNGQSWAKPATLLSTNGSNPNILMDPTSGNPIAIWADLSAGGTSNVIRCAELSSGMWAVSTISATGLTFSDVHASINSAGNAAIIWCRQPTADADNVVEATTSM
ncbi:MAG: hypothetical protein KGI83_00425 [Verrucomicrobiota bacterium]|nr:hypothetical protein [Verrucomicrobiota bacterium]